MPREREREGGGIDSGALTTQRTQTGNQNKNYACRELFPGHPRPAFTVQTAEVVSTQKIFFFFTFLMISSDGTNKS